MSIIEHELREREPLQDHCGVVGILTSHDAYLFDKGLTGIKRLQTRGYDGAGFVALREDGSVLLHKNQGTVMEVFPTTLSKKISTNNFFSAQFQVRYGTSGETIEDNVQPLIIRHDETGDLVVLVHNGQFSKKAGTGANYKSDTVQFFEKIRLVDGINWDERILNSLRNEGGAWSLVIHVNNSMYLARDPLGIRPLYFGCQIEGDQVTYMAASETVALEAMGISQFQEVMPGQLLRFDKGEIDFEVFQIRESNGTANCIFEDVYTMDKDGRVFAPRNNPYEVRNSMTIEEMRARSGEILAQEAPLTLDDVDVVVGIPGTAIPGGMAYAKALGLPYEQLIEDRDTPEEEQRTFMHAEIDKIYRKIMEHFKFKAEGLRGKKIALVDDSLVRGNISTVLTKLLMEQYGVLAVHFRILSPPIDKPCHLGINTRNKSELIAARHKLHSKGYLELVENIREEIGPVSLAYLSSSGLLKAIGFENANRATAGFCMGCMYGHNHPVNEKGEVIA